MKIKDVIDIALSCGIKIPKEIIIDFYDKSNRFVERGTYNVKTRTLSSNQTMEDDVLDYDVTIRKDHVEMTIWLIWLKE